MAAQIAIVHGWSDTSRSFIDLRDFLVAHGYTVAQIWLGDYVSLDDDVRIEDVAKRMESVVRDLLASGKLAAPFDLIVHSTGGLVAREWVASFYPDGLGCPVKRIVMLAPANFGSRLASMGKSMIGRVAKGWNNWFQTGAQMLSALELASPYQWNLARRDLLDASGGGAGGPYGHNKIWPFVITGTRAYESGLRQIVNEHGSDGTVRPAAANLNAHGLTIDFAQDPANPAIRAWSRRAGDLRIPFAVLPDRNHSSITRPVLDVGSDQETAALLGRLVVAALECPSDARYGTLAEEWETLSERTAALSQDADERSGVFGADPPDRESFNQYMQWIAFARDDDGIPIDDYFLEFFSPDARGNEEAVFFHREVLEHVHVNSMTPSRRCLYIDRTDLLERFYDLIPATRPRRLAVSISAAPLGPNVRYFESTREGAEGHVLVHEKSEAARAQLDARLHRNSTHLVELVIPRRALEKVFRLTQ